MQMSRRPPPPPQVTEWHPILTSITTFSVLWRAPSLLPYPQERSSEKQPQGLPYPDYGGNGSNTPPHPRAAVPCYPQLSPRYPSHIPRSMYAYFFPRPEKPDVFSGPLSNPYGCTPVSCTARGSDRKRKGYISHDQLRGPEMKCSSYQNRYQGAAAEPQESERMEAGQGESGYPAQVLLLEIQTMIHVLAPRISPVAAPYGTHPDRRFLVGAPQ